MNDIDQVKANLGAINAVLQALIETHPNRAELGRRLRSNAERTETLLLDSTVSDEAISRTRDMIAMYALMASIT